MKKILGVLCSIFMLAGCGSVSNDASYKQISQEDAASIMESGENYIILDVRRPDEFAAGHIPNAINIANETIGTEEIPQLPEKDQLILVYCRSGNRSQKASAALAELGYPQVYEFGGIGSWPYDIVTD